MALSSYKLTLCLSLIAVFLGAHNLWADPTEFERDVAPILEEHCWHCHGEEVQESGLRLDLRHGMLRGGDSGLPAVVPGERTKSYLIEVINHVNEDMAMPPDEEKLPAEKIAKLKRWIAEGAIWPGQMQAVAPVESDHWSFQPVIRPAIPIVRGAESPIDAFLQTKLAEEELSPSPAADPRLMIRRVSIILTGLIPAPEAVKAFISDYQKEPEKAYRGLVEQLLESKHFGERWAQHWLDVIRWAETNGSEANLYRKNAWFYRDYVVRAFNEDMPYDQFIREQIAGDSMGAGEATGFLVAGPHVPPSTVGREPAAIRQARADRMDEIMQTVGASIMGLTIGCARCHNHKFDPITIKDYYAMTGVFQDLEFGGRPPEYSANHPRQIRANLLREQIDRARDKLRGFGGWEESWGAYRELHFRPVTTPAIRIRFKMPNVGIDELEVFGPDHPNENLAESHRGTRVVGFPEKGTDNRNPITRVNDGEYGAMAWRAQFEKESEDRAWVRFDFDKPERVSCLRVSSNREYYYDTDYLEKKPHLPRYEFDIDVMDEDGAWQPWVGTWSVNKQLTESHSERGPILDKLQELIKSLATEGPQTGFIGRFVRPGKTHVLLRGSPETPRDEVFPAGPAILSGELGLTSVDAGPVRRARFAEWISRADNPLTARVMVNRIWHHVFGTGIVPTTSDFGSAGARPSHPELLDWLAAEFREPTYGGNASRPWSVKSIIRLLVMSDAFRQSSLPTAEGLERDASSTLLWRFPPKRVEAEVIRDSILQASGSLDDSIGGRGYRIHNEKKTYAQWEVVDNHGPETWRRMLYQERMRRVDDGIFTAFDFPDCGQVRAKRPVSTTPLQALNLMNSEFVIDQSQRIADRARRESGNNARIAVDRCFELLLNRVPSDQERRDCLELASVSDLSLVCRALINSNEFAFLP